MQVDLKLTLDLQLGTPQSQGQLTSANNPTDATEATKREIMLEDLSESSGYQPDFLSLDDELVPLPELTENGKQLAAPLFESDDKFELKYSNYSLAMHKQRRLALFTAANVDWRDDLRLVNGRIPNRDELNVGIKWIEDPRIAETHQLPDKFFSKDNGAFDKGHIVERHSVCWGQNLADMQLANRNTFFTSNCTPQTSQFNQSRSNQLNWRALELMIARRSDTEKVCMLAGPVLNPEDRKFTGIDRSGEVKVQIPAQYWKIVVAKGPSGPESYGFMLEQDLSHLDLEFVLPEKWAVKSCPIEEIEQSFFGLATLTWYKQFDQFTRGMDS